MPVFFDTIDIIWKTLNRKLELYLELCAIIEAHLLHCLFFKLALIILIAASREIG
jgi:hypothetical protein